MITNKKFKLERFIMRKTVLNRGKYKNGLH